MYIHQDDGEIFGSHLPYLKRSGSHFYVGEI